MRCYAVSLIEFKAYQRQGCERSHVLCPFDCLLGAITVVIASSSLSVAHAAAPSGNHLVQPSQTMVALVYRYYASSNDVSELMGEDLSTPIRVLAPNPASAFYLGPNPNI
jgi:hypothetical protein